MKKVTLNFLASDFLETDYFDYFDCAITRAVHRAGFLEADHDGHCISEESDGEIHYYICNDDDRGLRELNDKIMAMYDFKPHEIFSDHNMMPIDFSVELEFNLKN